MRKYQAYFSIFIVAFFLFSQFAPVLNFTNAQEALEATVTEKSIPTEPAEGFVPEQTEVTEQLVVEEAILTEVVVEEELSSEELAAPSNIMLPAADPNFPPVVTITTPNEGSVITATSLTVNVTAIDDSGMGSYYIRLWQNGFDVAGGGTLQGNCQSAPGGNLLGTTRNDTCTFDLTAVPDGTYFVSAQYLDENIAWGIDINEIIINNTPVAPVLPSVSIDDAFARIVNGHACGTGSAVSDDGLRVTISDWNSTDYILQGRYFFAGGSFTSWFDLASRAAVNVSGSNAEYIYMNTGNTLSGIAGWEVRVIDSTTQDVLSNVDSLNYTITNDLNSLACGGNFTLGFEIAENSPQIATGQCYVSTADASQQSGTASLQILRWNVIENASSYVLNGYSWNGSSWVVSYTNFIVPNSSLDFTSEPGYVIYTGWATGEARYAYEVFAYDASSNLLSQTPSISNPAICTFTVDRSAPPVDNADISVEKISNVSSVLQGESVTYTVTITNNSLISTATNIIALDTLSGGVGTVNTATLPVDCSVVSNQIICDIAALMPGQSQVFTYSVTVDSVTGTQFTNTVSIDSDLTETNIGNNTDNVVIDVVVPEPTETDIEVTKTVDKTLASPGDTLVYVVTIENISNEIAENVVAEEAATFDVLNVDSITITQGSCTFDSINEVYTCQIGDMNPGQVVTLTMNVTILTNASGLVANAADAYPENIDTDTTNNFDFTITLIIPAQTLPDIEVTKTADVSTAKVGDVINYTVTISNIGDTVSEDVVFSDTMDYTKINIVTYSIDSGMCNMLPGSNTISCSIDQIAPGEVIVFRLSVMPKEAHEMYNAAYAYSDTSIDPNEFNNVSTISIPVSGTQPPQQQDLKVIIFGTSPATNDGVTIRVGSNQNFNVVANLVPGQLGQGPYTYTFSGICSGLSNNNNSTNFTANTLNLTAGSYYCTVQAVDSNGRVSTSGAPIIVFTTATVPTNPNPTPTTPTQPQPTTPIVINEDAEEVEETDEDLVEEEETDGTILGETTCEITQKVNGFVYNDSNTNGSKDSDDQGLENIKINIYFFNEKGERRLLTTDRTNSSGMWEVNLCAGEYEVVIDESTLPGGYKLAEDTENSFEIIVEQSEDLDNINFELIQEAGFNWLIVIIPAVILLLVLLMLAARKRDDSNQA